MSIFVNRILNMKTIKAVGFDMDFTLVRYHGDRLEGLAYKKVIEKLIHSGYSAKHLNQLEFDFNRCSRGLVLDKEKGNILKLSLYSKVKSATHGTKSMSYKEMNNVYKGLLIDLNDSNYYPIDTFFSISHGVLFAQLVDLKDKFPDEFPLSYNEMEADILYHIDMCHRDGSIKDEVKKDLGHYIIKDPQIVEALEKLKEDGKLLWLITNSDYEYTRPVMNFAFDPYLKNHKSWIDLFDVSVTFARKPGFFTNPKQLFLEVDPDTTLMNNTEGPYRNKIFQSGNAVTLEKEFNLTGEEILYLGDHIFGDILKLKKACNWRTALVIEELDQEVKVLKETAPLESQVNELMDKKEKIEDAINNLYDGDEKNSSEIKKNFAAIDKIDSKIRDLLTKMNQEFNPYWGELMRAGAEPSRFAGQVEKYACIYMSKVSDMIDYSNRKYFRPPKKNMPHDQV